MMRFLVSIFATAAMFMVASTASATLIFTVQGQNLTTASTDLSLAVDGDVVQLDIFVTNTGGGVASLGAGIFGLTAGSFTNVSGATADSWFNDSLFFGVLPSNGIGNNEGTAGAVVGGVPQNRTLDGTSVIAGGTAIRVFNGVSTSVPSPDGDGTFDLGVGDYTNTGTPHARVTFEVVGIGSFATIGTDIGVLGGHIDGTGANVAATDSNTVIQIGVVPEPGTALLMGLGLSGLALAGRRQ